MARIRDRRSRLEFTTEEFIGYSKRKINRKDKNSPMGSFPKNIVIVVDRDGYGGMVGLLYESRKKMLPFSFKGLYHWAAKNAADRKLAEKKKARRR